MQKFICTLLLLAVFQSAVGQSQRAVLYEGRDSTGEYIIIPQTYVPDLSANNFDNRVRSVCVTGVWIFYVETDYNVGINAGVEYVFGVDNYCTNLATVGKYVSSVRFVGAPNDYRSDTFSLFEGTYYQGAEEYTFVDLPSINLDGRHKSLIITGASAWTIYDGTNYLGNSICLYPPPSNNYTPYFLAETTKIDVPYGSIKSIRKGCYEKHVNNVAAFARFGGSA